MAGVRVTYNTSDLPDIFTKLYHSLKDNNYLFANTSPLDQKLKLDLEEFRNAWKQCFKDATERLYRTQPTPHASGQYRTDMAPHQHGAGALTPASMLTSMGGLTMEQRKEMIFSSFDEKDQHKLKKELKREDKMRNEIERENTELRNQNEHLERRIKELQESLSQVMGEKMSSDERRFENINDPHRPLAIAEDYRMFCSKHWLDAKNKLDGFKQGQLDEKTKCVFLSRLIEVASLGAQTCVNGMLDGLRTSPGTMTMSLDHVKKDKGGANEPGRVDQTAIPDQLKVAVTKFLKLGAQKVETRQWGKMVFSAVMEEMAPASKQFPKKDLSESDTLRQYVEAGCRLSWMMAVQLPPMRISTEDVGRSFDPNKHELAMNSVAPARDTVVDYFVNPTLFHAENVIMKGRVVLKRGHRK